MRFKVVVIGCAMVGCAVFTGCGKQLKAKTVELAPFAVTNYIVGGVQRQVLQLTNGMELYFTSSDLVVWFNEENCFSIEFDSKTKDPLNILLKKPATDSTPASSVYDINADGIPEFKRNAGGTNKQVFYLGEWYPVVQDRHQTKIIHGGKDLPLKYDGRLWREKK